MTREDDGNFELPSSYYISQTETLFNIPQHSFTRFAHVAPPISASFLRAALILQSFVLGLFPMQRGPVKVKGNQSQAVWERAQNHLRFHAMAVCCHWKWMSNSEAFRYLMRFKEYFLTSYQKDILRVSYKKRCEETRRLCIKHCISVHLMASLWLCRLCNSSIGGATIR